RAAPRHLYDAIARRELGGRLGERPVLHHEPPCEHGRQHGGARDDADSDQQRPFAACPESRRNEAKREHEAAERRHVTAASFGGVVSCAQTSCAASTNACAAAEWWRSR